MRQLRLSARAWLVFTLLYLGTLLAGCTLIQPGESQTFRETPTPTTSGTTFPLSLSPLPPAHTSTALPSITPLSPLSSPPIPSPSSTPAPWLAEFRFGAWEQVLAVAWSPDGKLLAASAGEKVYIFEGEINTPIQVLQINSGADRLVFSPEQNSPVPYLLAAAAKDGTVQLWDALTGQKLVAWGAHQKGARSVAFHPTGGILATTGGDAMVRLWELPQLDSDLPEAPALRAEMIGGAYIIPDAKFSPDGSLVASVDIHDIRLRDPATQRLVRTLRGETSIFRIAFSPEGSLLAAAEMGNRLSLWETASGLPLGVWSASGGQAVEDKVFLWDLVFSPDGKWLAAGGSDGMITLWRSPAGQVASHFPAHAQAVTSLAFNPQGQWLASGGLDGALRLWDVSFISSSKP